MNSKLIRRMCGIVLIVFVFGLVPVVNAQTQEAPILTLKECIQKGLKNDPDLVRADQSLRNINNTLWTDYGAWLPSVSTGVGYTWNSRPQVVEYKEVTEGDSTFTVPVYTNESYSSSISLNMNLFNGFSDYFGLRADRQTKKSIQENYSGQVLNTVYSIKTGYYNVLQYMKLADVQRKALERSQEQLRITQTRYDLGSAALSDVLKAKVSLGQAQLDLINAENNYKVSVANLNYLIGEPIDEQYRVDTTVGVREVNYTLQGSIDSAMSKNPTLQSYKYSMDASQNGVRSAWGGFLPSINFSYSTSWYDIGKFQAGGLYSNNNTYRYGVNLSLNIFDRFVTKRQVASAQAALNTDKFVYHNYKSSLKLQVTQSYLNLEKAQLSIQVSRDNLASAQEDYKLAQEKYTLGAATILDLLDAEVSLRTAESNVIESEYNLNLAVADLERALGKFEY